MRTGFDPHAVGFTATQVSAIILAGMALAIVAWVILDYRHLRRVLRSPRPSRMCLATCRENCDTSTACRK